MHRPVTTVRPASRPIAAASSERMPGWSQSTFAPISAAVFAIAGASSAGRKTCTTSTGTSTSLRSGKLGSPSTSDAFGLTGTIRKPCAFRYRGT